MNLDFSKLKSAEEYNRESQEAEDALVESFVNAMAVQAFNAIDGRCLPFSRGLGTRQNLSQREQGRIWSAIEVNLVIPLTNKGYRASVRKGDEAGNGDWKLEISA